MFELSIWCLWLLFKSEAYYIGIRKQIMCIFEHMLHPDKTWWILSLISLSPNYFDLNFRILRDFQKDKLLKIKSSTVLDSDQDGPKR